MLIKKESSQKLNSLYEKGVKWQLIESINAYQFI